MSRRIAHLDMDAFFASVELLRYPELRGLPVVIGGGSDSQPSVAADGTRLYSRLRHYVGRGVITTATYEARKLGVHSAMGLMKAAQLAPEAILLPTDFNRYRQYSRRFKEAVAAIAPTIEDRGIDEIYIDLTEHSGDSLTIAQSLKQAVWDATGLTCSIGISPNKLLSKIASDLDKPDGITLIRDGDLEARIWPLPVGTINGIGPKAQKRLRDLDVNTVGELARSSRERLRTRFGERYTDWLLEVANGRDDRPVVTESTPKSISRETTFERDLHLIRDEASIARILDGLCERVAGDLKRKQVIGRTVGVKVRFDDFRIVTRDQSFTVPVADIAAIAQAARHCLARVAPERRIRLLGIRIGGLVPEATSFDAIKSASNESSHIPEEQLSLFPFGQ